MVMQYRQKTEPNSLLKPWFDYFEIPEDFNEPLLLKPRLNNSQGLIAQKYKEGLGLEDGWIDLDNVSKIKTEIYIQPIVITNQRKVQLLKDDSIVVTYPKLENKHVFTEKEIREIYAIRGKLSDKNELDAEELIQF
jgi:hypothetical protein